MNTKTIIQEITKKLNNRDRIIHIKYEKSNPLINSTYFPDKWGLILSENKRIKNLNINLQKSFEVQSKKEGVDILEQVIHPKIIAKIVELNEKYDKLYLILYHN